MGTGLVSFGFAFSFVAKLTFLPFVLSLLRGVTSSLISCRFTRSSLLRSFSCCFSLDLAATDSFALSEPCGRVSGAGFFEISLSPSSSLLSQPRRLRRARDLVDII